ncbi:MAG: hypothetical protein CMC14_06495 [Flavobacteriaceae bacterium]|nr:hypothetical protein [Flavobacteriaceae bacterium]
MSKYIWILLFLCIGQSVVSQNDTLPKKLKFTGDFRFRAEPDWDSRKSDGTFRDNRTRLRYRLRFGANYDFNNWLQMGVRLRTGLPGKQQDPQLTLGDGFNEGGTLPIGLEKAFAQFKFDWFQGWIGKNTFPFEKQNELFWSDNVYPDGIAAQGSWSTDLSWVESIGINTGHFIIASNNGPLDDDAYFQGIQLVSSHVNQRITLFPGFYYFNSLPDIPDGNGTFTIDYSILHLGGRFEIFEKPKIGVEVDWYQNLQDYNKNDSIATQLRDQRQGLVASVRMGKLKKKGDWKARITYTRLERFAAVDFLAQNDWARWDYSSQGSLDGRLTNYKGLELMLGYMITDNIKVNSRYFMVEQLIPYGPFTETGQRIRFDVDIGF